MKSLLALLLSLSLALPQCASAPVRLRKRDADFNAVRTRLTKSRSGEPGDPKEKYFHESVFHPHYDGRFADRALPDNQRRERLVAMVQSYFATMNDIGAQTWIMHGTLLGWWWNRKIFPWDSDIDVQMSESSMRYIADWYNMTVHHYRFPADDDGIGLGGRDYLLEVNPNYSNASVHDIHNRIDARWIDMDSGLFIDITTLRLNRTAEALGIPGMMMCKDLHWYRERDVYPLRDSVFEGVRVKIPYAYSELLEEEYGPKSLSRTQFEGHRFDAERMEWLPDPSVPRTREGRARRPFAWPNAYVPNPQVGAANRY